MSWILLLRDPQVANLSPAPGMEGTYLVITSSNDAPEPPTGRNPGWNWTSDLGHALSAPQPCRTEQVLQKAGKKWPDWGVGEDSLTDQVPGSPSVYNSLPSLRQTTPSGPPCVWKVQRVPESPLKEQSCQHPGLQITTLLPRGAPLPIP